MVTLQQIKPQKIEEESFRIIEEEFLSQTGHTIDEYGSDTFKIIQRVVHATGDFSFASALVFHPRAIEAGISSIKGGKNILIDVNMGASGISRALLKVNGGDVICRVGDTEIGKLAKEKGLTRSEAAFEFAASDDIGIVVIGNAPTALLAAMRLQEEGKLKANLIVGVPVGFVNAEESKAILSGKEYPFITSLGRKGGSPVAVAITNALLRLAQEKA